MPPLQSYDPILIGFVEGKGPVQLHLQAAQDEYGRLPSDFGLLSDVKNRRARRTLNLPVGLAVLDLLRDGNGLPELLAQFYERWGRDFRKDFGVDIARFHRLNDPWTLGQIVEENRAGLADCLAVDVLDVSARQRVRSALDAAVHPGGSVPGKGQGDPGQAASESRPRG